MQRADLRFDQMRRRFAFVANRFAWDALPEKQRRRAGIHFDDVAAVQVAGLQRLPADAVLSLLAITYEGTGTLAGTITLSFSAGIGIRLQVACINVTLADLVALGHDDLEHAGHDLGPNILGHLHPNRVGHSRRLAADPSRSCISNHRVGAVRGARAFDELP